MGKPIRNRRGRIIGYERNAARDAAFYANYKQNEVNSFINSGNSGRDTIVSTYGKTKSGLSDIRVRGGPNDKTDGNGAKVKQMQLNSKANSAEALIHNLIQHRKLVLIKVKKYHQI